jgi:hypothetical protein
MNDRIKNQQTNMLEKARKRKLQNNKLEESSPIIESNKYFPNAITFIPNKGVNIAQIYISFIMQSMLAFCH